MRSLALLCVVIVGILHQPINGQECIKLKLNYLNYGESWFVDAEGSENGTQALRFSENQEYFFDTTETTYYDILFTENTSVDRLKSRFHNTENVTVDVFQNGSPTSSKTVTQTTGTGGWELYRSAFVIELEDVTRIRVTWVTYAATVGIKKLVVVVCESDDPCTEDVVYNTTKTFDLPAGFSIDVEGPPLQSDGGVFSTNPIAVLDGAKAGGIQLRSNADGTNYIVMNFDSDVKIRTFDIFLKNAEGLTIECYDVAGDLIYTGSIVISRIWNQTQIKAFIGPISRIRQINMKVSFDKGSDGEDPTSITAKRLTFTSCQ